MFLLLYGKHGNITLLCTIGYAIMNSMENLRFGKENYFYVLVFYMLFFKRNRKHFLPCSHTLYKHSWKFGRIRNSVETRSSLVRFQLFAFLHRISNVNENKSLPRFNLKDLTVSLPDLMFNKLMKGKQTLILAI